MAPRFGDLYSTPVSLNCSLKLVNRGMDMKKCVLLAIAIITLSAPLCVAERRAKNVILFIGDAAGMPVISLAAAYKGQPQSLFIQRMPNIGLSDTSTASLWVTDSAAGMTAIVTGHKTQNGVISQSDSAVRGQK